MFLNRINTAISSVFTAVKDASQGAEKPRHDVQSSQPFAIKKLDAFQPLVVNSNDKHDLAAAHEYNGNCFIEKAKTQGPRGGISAKMLSQQAKKLQPIEAVKTPFSEQISILRGGEHVAHKAGYQFADFATTTRQHLTELATTYAGKKLALALAKRDQDMPTRSRVGIQDAGPDKGFRASCRALRTEASPKVMEHHGRTRLVAGAGSSSLVTHHVDIGQRWGDKSQLPAYLNKSIKQLEGNIGQSGAIALGHELIHAAHAAHGYLLQQVQSNGLPMEEAVTVGQKGKDSLFARVPTENQIRADMNLDVFNNAAVVKTIQSRDSYTGKVIEPVMAHEPKKSNLREQ